MRHVSVIRLLLFHLVLSLYFEHFIFSSLYQFEKHPTTVIVLHETCNWRSSSLDSMILLVGYWPWGGRLGAWLIWTLKTYLCACVVGRNGSWWCYRLWSGTFRAWRHTTSWNTLFDVCRRCLATTSTLYDGTHRPSSLYAPPVCICGVCEICYVQFLTS